jgi:hypothetical protein
MDALSAVYFLLHCNEVSKTRCGEQNSGYESAMVGTGSPQNVNISGSTSRERRFESTKTLLGSPGWQGTSFKELTENAWVEVFLRQRPDRST